MITATCHCGAIAIALPAAPDEITHCNCSLCRRIGVLWAYYPIADATLPEPDLTQTYAWNGKYVDFHRCKSCGCLTHWLPRKASRKTFGLNARLVDAPLVTAAKTLFQDSASTGVFY